jgi:hypothetical protein
VTDDRIRINIIIRSNLDRLTKEKITIILGKIPRRGGRPPSERRLKKMNILNNLLEGTRFNELKLMVENR